MLYYNNAVNDDWSTLGNWWQDVACTIPATGFPTSSDDVTLLADVGGLSSNAGIVYVYSADLDGGRWDIHYYGITLHAVDTCIFRGTGGNVGGIVTAPEFLMYDNSNNGSIMNGNCTLYGFSHNYWGVYGDMMASGDGSNHGYVTGDATFVDRAINAGTIQGDAWFYDESLNNGPVNGNAFMAGDSNNLSRIDGYIVTPWVRSGTDLVSDKTGGTKLKFIDVPEGGSDILGAGML